MITSHTLCSERIAELEAEVDNLTAKGTPGWLRLRELERERDEANTGAIAQRRAFEKTLEKRDKLIAELEVDADKQFKLRAQAEAKLAALRAALTDERRLTNEATASRKQAEAENEWLKCCGNCRWDAVSEPTYPCDACNTAKAPPSRWEARQ
jgi:hypothetical protein